MVFIPLRPWPCLVISATIYLCDRHCHWSRTHLFRSTDRTWCKWSCLRPVRGATVAKSRDKFLWHVRAEPSCSLCLDAPPSVRQRVNHTRLPGRYFRPPIFIRITAESDCTLEVLPSEFRSQKSVVFAGNAEWQIYRSSGRGDVPFDAFLTTGV